MAVADEVQRLFNNLVSRADPDQIVGYQPGFEFALNPPATSEAIDAAERQIGVTFPAQLRELYEFTNGGPLGTFAWATVQEIPEGQEFIDGILRFPGLDNFASTPGRGLRWVAARPYGIYSVLCEVDDEQPGRVFLFDTQAEDLANKLWRRPIEDLETYFSCLADFAELGQIAIDQISGSQWSFRWREELNINGPTLDGFEYQYPAGIEILRKHGVSFIN